MNQTRSLLFLRSRQIYRYLNEIGFGVLLVAIFLLTGVIFQALHTILNTSASLALLLSASLLFSIELKRTDKYFLQSLFNSKREFIIYKFIENTLMVLPILIFQAYFRRLDICGGIILINFIISYLSLYISKPIHKESKISIKSIPISLFEIKFYFENKIWSISFAMILLICGVFHISLWILGMVLFCTLPIELYSFKESREMLQYTPSFVRNKIVANLGFFLLLVSAPTLITILSLEANIVIFVYGIIALILSIILSISKKYVSYYGVNETVPSMTSTSILTFIMLAPGGIIITLAACIYYYIQAEKHMKNIYAIN